MQEKRMQTPSSSFYSTVSWKKDEKDMLLLLNRVKEETFRHLLLARAGRERGILMHSVNIRVLKDSNVRTEKIKLGDRHREPVPVRN